MQNVSAAPKNHVEAIKAEQDGLEVLGDLPLYASEGVAALSPAAWERLKWYGVYVQRPREDKKLMLRIKLPGGALRADQALRVAELAQRYGRGLVDITTRQDLELHWLDMEDLPAIFAALNACGLTTRQAAGDGPRNIIASPVAGLEPGEVLDVRPLVRELNGFFDGNRDFSNLPRKFKLSISGHPAYAAQGESNDLAFLPAEKVTASERILGFHVRVGGGLATQPQLAKELDLFVRPEEVLTVARGVATVFKEHGYRERRNHCRLKYLVADWGEERFLEELLRHTGPLMKKGTSLQAASLSAPGWLGWQAQKQAGRSWLGVAVPAGRLTSKELEALGDMACRYGDGTLSVTADQNLVLLNLASSRKEEILKEPVLLRLTPFPSALEGLALTCPGREVCPFAVLSTKDWVPELLASLQRRIQGKTPLRIYVSGCPNSCVRPQMADVGLQGVFVNVGGKAEAGFEILLGGGGTQAVLAQRLEGRIPIAQIEDVLEEFIRWFEKEKQEQELFGDFVARQGLAAFQERFNAYQVKK